HPAGNGMYLSWGNARVNPHVGLLFIDFQTQRRMRVNGTASINADDALLGSYPEAQFVVRVTATEFFPNCPRYIHKLELVERSRFVPHAGAVDRRGHGEHLAHPRAAGGALVADDHDVARLDAAVRHRAHRGLLALEDSRGTGVVAALVAGELHDAALGGDVAAQDRQAAGL